MQLVRFNPIGSRLSFQNHFNQVFDNFFYPAARGAEESQEPRWNPRVDIYDDKDNIVVKAEIPGIEKKDLFVDLKGRVLTLKGERSYDDEVKEDKYFRRESCFGRFERSFTLPGNVDSEAVKAEYKDGVLKINIPKPEENKPKAITIH